LAPFLFLAVIEINYTKPTRGDWLRFTSQRLVSALSRVDFVIDCDNVWQNGRHIESLLIDQVNIILLLTRFKVECA
jgi:hypothetical protein